MTGTARVTPSRAYDADAPAPSLPAASSIPSLLGRSKSTRVGGGGGGGERYKNAWDKQVKPKAAAIQRTFELNKSAVDDVLLDAKDIQREQLLRVLLLDEEEKIDKGEPWGHPAGEKKWLRYLLYWLGPFGPVGREYAFFQPVNDLLTHLESSQTSLLVFDSFFSIALLNFTVAEPENSDIVYHWGWTVSTVIFTAFTPIALLLCPVSILHMRSMAAVSRPRLRRFLGQYAWTFSMTHGMRIWIFIATIIGLLFRCYAIHATYHDGNGLIVLVAFALGTAIMVATTWSTVDMYYSTWLPWEEARVAAAEKEEEKGDDAFYFSVDGRKLKPLASMRDLGDETKFLVKLKQRKRRYLTAPVTSKKAASKPGIVRSASLAMNDRFTDLFEAFQYVDTDKSGTLDRDELRYALRSFILSDMEVDEERIEELVQACDKDGSGHVDYKEFMAAFVSQAQDIGVPVPRTNCQLQRLATEHSIGRPRVGRRRVFADVAQAKQAEAQDGGESGLEISSTSVEDLSPKS